MKKERFFLSLIGMLAFVSCNISPKKRATESQYRTHCGSCHLAPDPANIPKSIWEEDVLPEMALRSGVKSNEYNPLGIYSTEEDLYGPASNTYPQKSIIDPISWQQIHDYVIDLAPDSIPVDRLRSKRNSALTQFNPTPLSFNENQIGHITSIQFEDITHQFIIGDSYGRYYKWPKPFDTTLRLSSPVMFHHQKEDDLYLLEIGYMNPSELARGALYRVRTGVIDTLAEKLHRPVYTEIADLNEDGMDEILICEFGNYTGELSLLVYADSSFEKRTLFPLPGTIKVELADMNGDGLQDIIVLASQGNEGIFIFYQEEDLQFRVDQVIQLAPEYGSSWFELIDYDADHNLDIVLVNGDNGDYSRFLKPYHGVRLFLNDGKNGFDERWFYPIYGATRVLAEDYDLDGDLDFAVMAYFPDLDYSPAESFIWLENKVPSQYLFEPYTFQAATSGRWLVMEKGDFDQDGDVDIMLGSFLLPIDEKQKTTMNRWRNRKLKLLLLENKGQD